MAEQLPLDLPIDTETLGAYLTSAMTLADEIDRLQADLRELRELYAERLPMRAVQTATGVVRKRKKLAEHATEPFSYAHQDQLEAAVQAHLERMEDEKRRIVPDMTG